MTANLTVIQIIARRFLSLCVLAVLTAAATQAQTASQDSLTIDQVVRDVVTRNDRVAAARYMQESAERRAKSTGTWDDPMLMLGVENVPTSFDFKEDDMTMRVTGLSQTIPYSGYKGLERKASQADALVAAAQLHTTQIDLATTAREAYYDLYYKQLSLRDLQEQYDLLQQIVSSNTARLRTNQTAQEDVLTSQADLWRLESTLLSLRQEVDAARYNLNSLRGIEPDSSAPPLAAPSLATPPESPAAWMEAAEQHYPELQRLSHQAESYGHSGSAARRMQWPMLTLFGSYGFRNGFSTHLSPNHEIELMPRDNMISFGANISLPIFSRGKQRQMARSMDAMQKSTLAEAEQLRREVRANILALYSRVQRLTQSLALYQGRVLPATQDAYRSTLAGFTTSRTSFATLLNSAVAVYRDRNTIHELNNELARTLAEVERYTTDPATWDSLTGAGTK